MGDHYYDRGHWDAPRRSSTGTYDGDYNSGYHRPYATVSPAGDYHDFRPASACGAERRTEIVRGNGGPYGAPPPWMTAHEAPYASPGRRHSSGGGGSSAWCFGDPEMKRRRRVASYKAYSAEGKLKASLRKGFRWIKVKCAGFVNGF